MSNPSLPELPRIAVELVREHAPESATSQGFLRLRRIDCMLRFSDGTASTIFPYDTVTRRALDAAAVVAHYRESGQKYVYLRSCVRPPVALRSPPPSSGGNLWELPAGLIEPDEEPSAAAARELEEELGFHVEPRALAQLGSPVFPAPGMVGELQYFFEVAVEPSRRLMPTEDGSPLEQRASIVAVPLVSVLEACRTGLVADSKTELALRRFAELP